MNTLEFLQHVLPASGYYCAATPNNKGGFRQRYFTALEDLADFVQLISESGADAYYAVSSFREAGSRKGANVQHTKLFALDIDVGKKSNSYADRKEALTALVAYIDKTGLPQPTIVSSGNGLHVYWPLTRALEPSVWLPIATALKQSAIDAGLIIDPAVPADVARVLRPVGTLHQGTTRPVRVLLAGELVDPDTFSQKLTGRVFAPRKTSLLDNLAVKNTEFPPAIANVIASKCQQIGGALFKPKEVSEPLWYALMGVAAFTEDPEATALKWSSGHPDFNRENTLSKLEQWKQNTTGPATCAKFDSANPGGCKGCPFKDKITSPVRLGAQFEAVEQPVEAKDAVASSVAIPAPFKRTTHGIKVVLDDTDIDVCPFDIYPVGYGRDDNLGFEVVRYHWNRPHVGWVELKLRQALLTEGHKDFATACADQGIVLYGKRQTELFQAMLRAYMDELRKQRSLTNIYNSMGWKTDHTEFVLGDTTYRREADGSVSELKATLASSVSKTGGDIYNVGGSRDEWISATAVLEQAQMPWHMFSLGMGWAAPLFAFSGLKGMTISLYGPTGGGKSLAQYWVQSIYGDPDKLHFAAKYTQNSLFARLGLYANLPMTIDEATMMQDKDVGDFLYWVSQGRDKARLNRSAEERDLKTWATPVLVSTNKSLQAKLLASGLDSDAQMMRLLEINIPVHKLFSKNSEVGKKIYQHLMANYGHAGREYIRYLVALGEDGIRDKIATYTEDFYKRYGAKFSGSERFWELAIVLQDVGSRIADELGLIKYDYTKGTEWVLGQVGIYRDTIDANKMDALDLLSEFLNDNAESAVTSLHTGKSDPYVDHSRLPRGEIRIRFDVYRPTVSSSFDRGTLAIDRGFWRRWLATRGADYKATYGELMASGCIIGERRVSMGKDTPSKVGQSHAIVIDLKHPRLAGALNDADEAMLTALPMPTKITELERKR